jgi:hypothetical protein
MAITPLPSAPLPTDTPAEFNSKAFAWVAALDDWTTEANALAVDVNDDANNAEDAAAIALASANFKGSWSSLSGALNVPAAVYHSNKFWMLLNNLANVTTSEPGVSADWVEIETGGGGGGGWFSSVSEIGTNTNAAASTLYVFTADLTLTLPASPAVGALVGVSNRSGVTTCVIGRNTKKIQGLSEDLTVDILNAGFSLVYTGTNEGWVIL